MRNFLSRLVRNEIGANSIEYGILAMLIGIALLGTIMVLGNSVNGHYETVGTDYSEAANAARE